MLNCLETQLHTIEAVVLLPQGVNVIKDRAGRVDNTPFQKTLMLKEGAKVMMTHNVSVVDGLTNGAMVHTQNKTTSSLA